MNHNDAVTRKKVEADDNRVKEIVDDTKWPQKCRSVEQETERNLALTDRAQGPASCRMQSGARGRNDGEAASRCSCSGDTGRIVDVRIDEGRNLMATDGDAHIKIRRIRRRDGNAWREVHS